MQPNHPPSPAAGEPAAESPRWYETPRGRSTLYLALVALLAGWALFHRLGEAHLRGDEALWAVLSDNMTRENFWIGEVFPGAGPTDRPPLYFWLTAATRGLFDDLELPHRVWAAAAGLGVVLLTYLLGRRLFGAETGLFAASLLLVNRGFSFHESHGPRSGVSDSLLTLFLVAAALCVWRSRGSARPLVGWIGAGLACGGANMLKPLLGFAGLGLLTLFHLAYREGVSPLRRLRGPVTAGLVTLLVMLPWNLSMWLTYGRRFVNKQYLWHIWDRAVVGLPKHLEGPFYYWQEVTLSSPAFWLFLPATLACLWWAVRGPDRARYGLLVIFALGWISFFSLFTSKRDWYVHPAFPFVALAIAGSLRRLFIAWPARSARVPSHRRRLVTGLATFAAAALLTVTTARAEIASRERAHYAPWTLYQEIFGRGEPRAPFLLVRFPADGEPPAGDPSSPLDPSYFYYLPRMVGAERANDFASMKPRLKAAAQRATPIVMVVSARTPPGLAARVDRWMKGLNARRLDRSYCTAYVRGLPDVRLRIGAGRPKEWADPP